MDFHEAGEEIRIPCTHCRAEGYIYATVMLLDEPYQIYKPCKFCEGKGYHVMFKDKGDFHAT